MCMCAVASLFVIVRVCVCACLLCYLFVSIYMLVDAGTCTAKHPCMRAEVAVWRDARTLRVVASMSYAGSRAQY